MKETRRTRQTPKKPTLTTAEQPPQPEELPSAETPSEPPFTSPAATDANSAPLRRRVRNGNPLRLTQPSSSCKTHESISESTSRRSSNTLSPTCRRNASPLLQQLHDQQTAQQQALLNATEQATRHILEQQQQLQGEARLCNLLLRHNRRLPMMTYDNKLHPSTGTRSAHTGWSNSQKFSSNNLQRNHQHAASSACARRVSDNIGEPQKPSQDHTESLTTETKPSTMRSMENSMHSPTPSPMLLTQTFRIQTAATPAHSSLPWITSCVV